MSYTMTFEDRKNNLEDAIEHSKKCNPYRVKSLQALLDTHLASAAAWTDIVDTGNSHHVHDRADAPVEQDLSKLYANLDNTEATAERSAPVAEVAEVAEVRDGCEDREINRAQGQSAVTARKEMDMSKFQLTVWDGDSTMAQVYDSELAAEHGAKTADDACSDAFAEHGGNLLKWSEWHSYEIAALDGGDEGVTSDWC